MLAGGNPMSYILEALKKSEQQRQIQPAGAKISKVLATPSGKAPAANQAIAGGLLALVLLGGAGLIFYPAASPNTDTGSGISRPSDEPPLKSAHTTPMLIIPGLPVTPPVANASPETLRAQQTIIRHQILAYSASTNGAAAQRRLEIARVPEELAKDQLAAPVQEESVEQPTRASASGPDLVNSSQPMDVSPAISTPFLHDIPDLKDRIPELRVSVSIYSNRPASRRARINGIMYYEGDNLTSSLVLDEIRPHSLVFSFNGRAFQVRP